MISHAPGFNPPFMIRRLCARIGLGLCLMGLLWTMALHPALASGSDDDELRRHTASSLRASLLFAPPAPGSLASGRRSVPLAFGMSALIPGAGQALNRQWKKAAIAFGAEVALLCAFTSWRKSGVDGRDAYQRTAHTYWSPLRYVSWLNDYADYLNQLPDGQQVDGQPIRLEGLLEGIDLSNPGMWSDVDQLQVRSLILKIRALEDAVYHPETGASFSHNLPFFGEQQYYELVGKYFQFAPGWEDYSYVVRDGVARWIDAEGNYLGSIDPEKTAADGSKPNVSKMFLRYADSHGEANAFLRRASRVSLLFLVNHLLAAVDAAVFAKLHNQRLETRLSVISDRMGVAQPAASVLIRW